MQEINLVPKIIFGDHALDYLKEMVNERIVIITDHFISSLPNFAEIKETLAINNTVTVFQDVVPDPPIENIIAGIKTFEETVPTVIIAIGGGSAIDAAKGIVYFACKVNTQIDRSSIYFVVIPTTSGTGSEVTDFAVITDKDKGLKYPLVEDDLLPDAALLETDLVMELPPAVTADTGIDVLTHAIEAYVSTNASPFSDALAEKAIRLVFENLPKAYAAGKKDRAAREKMHQASTIAGLAFTMASLGINHSLAHAIGGTFHLVHGRINGVLLKNVILYNSGLIDGQRCPETDRALKRYSEIAQMIGVTVKNPQFAVQQLTQNIQRLLKQLEMPQTFSEFGIDASQYAGATAVIAQAALKDRCTPTNPRKPNISDLEMLLKRTY